MEAVNERSRKKRLEALLADAREAANRKAMVEKCIFRQQLLNDERRVKVEELLQEVFRDNDNGGWR